MKLFFILICAVLWSGSATSQQYVRYAATSPQIEYIGRTMADVNGSVSFDWSGTYLYVRFTGGDLSMRVSDTKKNYYNLFIDGELQPEVVTTFGVDSLIVLAAGLSADEHLICLQKRTEGEQGCTTIHAFEVAENGVLLQANMRKGRRIEYIGDSLTCGFGTEGKHRDEPFLPQTENCNLSYACILARYFDADYTLIAHSGRGMVRNYGDKESVSASGTLNHILCGTFDEREVAWDYPSQAKPDVVVINLGTNDFSTNPHPSQQEYTDGCKRMVAHLRKVYGQIPILCIAPHVGGEVVEYVSAFVENSGDGKLYFMALMEHYRNPDTDLGSLWHPNHEGQRKMAMAIAPYLSTATGWKLPHRVVE